MNKRLNRRNVLRSSSKLAALALAGAATQPALVLTSGSRQAGTEPPPAPLAQVTTDFVNVRRAPSARAALVDVLLRDAIMPLTEQVAGQALKPNNPIWYRTNLGFVYSDFVRPITPTKNIPDPTRAFNWLWGEITVPYTDARLRPDLEAGLYLRLYYTGVFRVIGAVQDTAGRWWYRLQEGAGYGPGPYALAEDIRLIDPAELTPLSPEVSDKRIEIHLAARTLLAYENNKPVMRCCVSLGNGNFGAPIGRHTVLVKYPTARLIGGEGANRYDLPGIGFLTFLSWDGVAIHTAYWHNDSARPRRRGCLNVPAWAAKWIWRWTVPPAPYASAGYITPSGVIGTPVIIS
ncbi:MAG: L,D-transpeptidase [Anaerolineae bacterium]|nr:L,D-transpeptidase [Thermoflexales bacterium]MDW8408987.1 L,D-transpeptidase [Anaerolineae bacterium]